QRHAGAAPCSRAWPRAERQAGARPRVAIRRARSAPDCGADQAGGRYAVRARCARLGAARGIALGRNAVKIVQFKTPGPASVLEYNEVPTPEPKQGEVLVRAHAIGVGMP